MDQVRPNGFGPICHPYTEVPTFKLYQNYLCVFYLSIKRKRDAYPRRTCLFSARKATFTPQKEKGKGKKKKPRHMVSDLIDPQNKVPFIDHDM